MLTYLDEVKMIVFTRDKNIWASTDDSWSGIVDSIGRIVKKNRKTINTKVTEYSRETDKQLRALQIKIDQLASQVNNIQTAEEKKTKKAQENNSKIIDQLAEIKKMLSGQTNQDTSSAKKKNDSPDRKHSNPEIVEGNAPDHDGEHAEETKGEEGGDDEGEKGEEGGDDEGEKGEEGGDNEGEKGEEGGDDEGEKGEEGGEDEAE